MTLTLHTVTAVLPTRQRPQYRPSWCPLPTSKASPTTAVRILNNEGRARKQLLGVQCHSVQGQHVHGQQEGPNTSHLDSALQQQWDHAANAYLGNIIIKPQSHKKVWWICDQCPDGHLHRWEATVQNRSNGNGCPQCSGHKVCKHNSLATKAPKIAAQWDFGANDGTPDSVVAQSNQPVGWLCDVCGHKWTAAIDSRVSKGNGCPHCAKNARRKPKIRHPTLAGCNHPLLAEWDHRRNAVQGHFPDQIKLRSGKQIFWLCLKCPAGQEHSWSAAPYHRTGRSNSGCPFCAGMAACNCNSLQSLFPGIAAEWDHSKNKSQPSDYTAGSDHLAWWSRPQRGSWQQTIHSRTQQLQQGPARLKRVQKRQDSAS